MANRGDHGLRVSAPTLDGQVVVVTGASRGIGEGIVARCLEAGARVLGVSRSGGGPAGADSRDYSSLELDVTDADAPERLLAAALDVHDRVDALVNNAGILISEPCWEQTDEQWDAMFGVNVTAPFLLSQRFARHWVTEKRSAAILNVCSIESEIGWKSPPQAAYAASKGAMLGLTRALALDLSSHGIRVVAIGPGVIDTGLATPEREDVERRIPLDHRFGEPEEIGDAAVFLLSDRASYITGEILFVDGGYQLV